MRRADGQVIVNWQRPCCLRFRQSVSMVAWQNENIRKRNQHTRSKKCTYYYILTKLHKVIRILLLYNTLKENIARECPRPFPFATRAQQDYTRVGVETLSSSSSFLTTFVFTKRNASQCVDSEFVSQHELYE